MNNSYRTPTERWQKNSDFQKGKKIPTNLGRAKEKRKKKQNKRTGTGSAPLGGAVKEEKFPHIKKLPHWWGWGGELWSHRGEHSNRGAEGKAGRFPHRVLVLTRTHQPEMLVC